jgi:hypothetical protein
MESIMAKAKKLATPAVETTQAPVAEVVTAPAVEQQAQPVQLTVNDLQLLGRIVDLASRRGAFQAAELSQVGDAFNKLTNFLSYVESVQKKEADAAAPAPAEVPAA